MGTLFDDLGAALDGADRRRTGAVAPADLVADLNPEQRAAVEHRGPPLLIVAGAGSGKTRVLTRRIAHLLATGDAGVGEILAITFTNKAAAEMRERVSAAVGPAGQRMWVSTFHSACVRILRREADRLGMSSSFSIYDSTDSQRLITMVTKELSLDPKRFTPRGVAARISSLKNELIDHEEFAGSLGGEPNPHDEGIAAIYAEYQRRLQAASAMDFDDLIGHTVSVLQLFDDVAAYYRGRFRHVLVDEYQDTNHAQYVLIRELVGTAAIPGATGAETAVAPGHLCVVGDADQSIYAFRGATIRNITEFEEDFPDAVTIRLEQNYRSTQTILDAANAVIAHNPERADKKLWTSGALGELITGYVADDEYDEARFVAGEIDRLTDEGAAQPNDVAIFYRTNAQSRALEEIMIRVGMPYKVVGAVRFYERREIRDAIAYLRAIANPGDDVSMRRILNVPKRGIGDTTESELAAFAARTGRTFDDACAHAADITTLSPRAVRLVGAFHDMMTGLREYAADDASPADILARTMQDTGYLEQLQQSDDPQDESRVENLGELESVAADYQQMATEPSLAGFLERVSLVADADQIPETAAGQVTLMTLHTAKGLEFPVVFLTGMEEGIFPHARTFDTDELPEERRLAYVGITRAMARLYLTRALTRSAWGAPEHHPASRFLAEIPPDLIEWRRTQGAATQAATTWTSAAPRPQGFSAPAPGPAVARASARGPAPAFHPGDRVTHDKFGLGTVVSVAGAGDKAEATVDFGSDGVKRLLLRYAPLEKL
ncbi:MAG: DNA helicase PcrA [Candidatus Nanopelagicales bacterium]